ncbi:MAG: DUF302 domain-containing protein [Halobacteriales archaeon]|nr:DUF302 domain-containing protein [Halobacteriales archaeon]
MSYTIQRSVDGSFDRAVEVTIEALGDAGFGILCDIDVQATFREKLSEEFRRYRILGACNPPLAHEGLDEEIALGALLPCNVVVYETEDGDVVITAVDPRRLVSITGNEALDPIADEVHERFERVLGEVAEELGTTAEV